ncbi:MAG TPA: M23 family peptidase, partial [Bacillales bacterium]|nr:M23 family peptidase [Bacillales bacterium]
MTNRADEIRKRHKERRKRRLQTEQFKDSSSDFQKSERLRDEFPASRDSSSEGHPLVRKEGMILRVMFAAVLFLVVGILFKNPAPALDQARSFVKETFRNEFQFAMVSDWYKEKFGEPLALLPKGNDSDKEMKASKTKAPQYAVPVSGGTVTATFADTGQRGIMVETGSNATVEAVKQG